MSGLVPVIERIGAEVARVVGAAVGKTIEWAG